MNAKYKGSNFLSYGMFRKTPSETLEALCFIPVLLVLGVAETVARIPGGELAGNLA
jgi:hypothetical protein